MLPALKGSPFTQPEHHLGQADPVTMGVIVAAASDLSVVLDANDRVEDFAIGADGLSPEIVGAWLGTPFEDCVTVESVPKIRSLVAAARAGEAPVWREVNHPMGREAADLPIRYCALRAGMGGSDGRVILIGRDLRPIAALQRRLLQAQQSLERDYERMRQVETRYRLIFQTAREAFLIVDAGSQRVVEANAAAGLLFGAETGDLVRRRFPFGFDAEGTDALETAFAAVRGSGRDEVLTLTRQGDGARIEALIALFRSGDTKLFLLRLSPQDGPGADPAGRQALLMQLLRTASEGIVLTDDQGRVAWANDAFLDLAQVPLEEQIRGASLDRFFMRQGIDLPVMLSNTRETGRLRHFATTLAGVYGAVTDVEVSAIALAGGDAPHFGIVIRNAALRPVRSGDAEGQFPHTVEQMTELVGRMPLKDLVRDTVDVIERLCIEAALKMTGDNRASAADLLGLSRQSLYVKLRRYGLSDPDSD